MKNCVLFLYAKRIVYSLLAIPLAGQVLASSPINPDTKSLHWHGYVSQGLVYTTENSFFGDSENTSFEMTNVALGATWRPWSRLQFSAQALYRQAGETSRDDIYTDYALADLTLIQDMSWQLGLRAGRIKNPVGFFNDTRDIAASRPSILLPESIYRDLLRDVYHTSDAISLYTHGYLGDNLIQIDLLSGEPQITEATENEFILAPLSGELDDPKGDIARILIEAMGGSLRLAYTYTNIEVDYEPAPGLQTIQIAPMVFISVPLYGYAGDTEIDLDTWSLEYNYQRWQFTTEYQRIDYYINDIFGPGSTSKTPGEGYYLSTSYQFNRQWQGFIRYDVSYTDKNDKDGKDYETETGTQAHTRFAKDTTIGIRYEHNKYWLFAAEFHHIKGTAWAPKVENDLNELKEDWNLFSAEISYKF
jgi:hypothetical protein